MTSIRKVSLWVLPTLASLALLALLARPYLLGTSRPSSGLVYPSAPKSDQVDDYHGVKVADPFRRLENSNDPETRAWIAAENKLTFAYLESIPGRKRIKERLTKLWNHERFGVPFKKGGRYFYTRNDGLQNQNVLYTLASLDSQPRMLLDPNTLSPDGTVALAGAVVSEDGSLLAYGVSASGSDWETWKVRSISTGKDLPDRLERIKFSSAAWNREGTGFYYGRYDNQAGRIRAEAQQGVDHFQKLYFHRLGQAQSLDELIYQDSTQPEWGYLPTVSDDGRYLLIHVWKGTDPKNQVYWKDLSAPVAPVRKLVPDFRAKFEFVGGVGRRMYFLTDLDAPRGRLVAMELTPLPGKPQEIVPQATETLEGASLVADRLLGRYLRDAHSLVRVHALDGRSLGEVPLPGVGSVNGMDGKRLDRETFFSFTGFTFPTTVYRHDFGTGKSEVFRRPKLDFDPDAYETRQVFYPAKDGTRIPMFLTHARGLVRSSNLPVYLYGYGGFNVSITPFFSTGNLAWLEMGGVLAIPNIRGGGEYGEEWHQAGIKANKQKGFDDFVAAAEWLIMEGYTRPARLAMGGGSNGGLLVGACMTQRPELFGAALPSVGVMDMLRFHRFTIGWAWTSDYGSPDDPGDFRVLHAYSPLHNLKPRIRYPAVLITTADHDDRVVPGHSFKFAATLQAALSAPGNSLGQPALMGTAPALIRIQTRAGHGAGKPVSMIIEETADRWAFLVRALGME